MAVFLLWIDDEVCVGCDKLKFGPKRYLRSVHSTYEKANAEGTRFKQGAEVVGKDVKFTVEQWHVH